MGCRERQRLLELWLDTISHHWRLHRLLDPAPLQGRGPTADQRLIAVVATAVLVLLAFALAAHLQAWGRQGAARAGGSQATVGRWRARRR